MAVISTISRLSAASDQGKDVCSYKGNNGLLVQVKGLSTNDDGCSVIACLSGKRLPGEIHSGCKSILNEWNELQQLGEFDRLKEMVERKCIDGDKYLSAMSVSIAGDGGDGPNRFCVNGKLVTTDVIWVASNELNFKSGRYIG